VLTSIDPTCAGSSQVGYPVLLKATGGGGGIGIYICHSKDDLVKNFETAGRCDLQLWDCMYGTACMGLHVWGCMCGTACMGLHVWDCMYETACMGLHVWDCMYGTASMVLHVCDCMCGTACMGLHVWDCMGAVCRIAYASRIASLS